MGVLLREASVSAEVEGLWRSRDHAMAALQGAALLACRRLTAIDFSDSKDRYALAITSKVAGVLELDVAQVPAGLPAVTLRLPPSAEAEGEKLLADIVEIVQQIVPQPAECPF